MNLASLAAGLNARNAVVGRIDALLFPEQLAFVLDPSRYCAALCSRRAGKSVAAAGKLVRRCITDPGSKNLYVALTRGSAKSIMWDILKEFCRKSADIRGVEFLESELVARFPNGSMIRLFGADANKEQREKILGTAWSDIVVDESASFRSDLRELIATYLRPSTSDKLGRISLIGTPGDFIGPEDERHLFYAVTTGDNGTRDPEPNWSVHRWNTLDNPHMRAQWQQELAALPPAFLRTAAYRNMYLGEWAVDLTRRVYRHDPSHDVDTPPPGLTTFCIGIDLGWDDPTAFVVGGWKPTDPTLYVLRAHKQKQMTLDKVAAEVQALLATYPNAALIIDGANKQAVETIRERYRLPLQAADKVGKADFIRSMNTDLEMGRIRLVRRDAQALADEWAALVWDKAARIPTELATCPNHLADSALYMWRHSYAFLGKPAAPAPGRDDEAHIEALWERKARRLEDDENGDGY